MPTTAHGGRIDVRRLIAATRDAHSHVVYFAHSLRDYGSPRAGAARQTLQSLWPGSGVLDPSEWGDVDILAEFGSYDAFYVAAVEGCDIVCALEHEGHIGRGVLTECLIALQAKKPVHVLRRNPATRAACARAVIGVRLVDPEDWSERYGRFVVAGTPEAATDLALAGPAPLCPRCEAPMAPRARKRDGGRFLGCIRFPGCRGSRPIDDGSMPFEPPDVDLGWFTHD